MIGNVTDNDTDVVVKNIAEKRNKAKQINLFRKGFLKT